MLRAIYLRAPGDIQHNFAIEPFVDELAVEVKADRVKFRLRYLKDPDMIRVLELAVKKAGWQAQVSPRQPHRRSGIVAGRGVSCTSTGHCAAIADVEVDAETGVVRVKKIVCALVGGRII